MVFSDKEYKQIIYEFNTKEELDKFIKDGKTDAGKKHAELKGTLELKNNITLMKKDKDKLVRINTKSILTEKDDYEQIIMYPTKERYLIVANKGYVAEDIARNVIHSYVCFGTGKEELEMFFNELKDSSKTFQQLSSVKEIKSDYFEKDNIEVLCILNGLWGYLDREDFKSFESWRTGKTYCDSLKQELKNNKKAALNEVKNLLAYLEVVDKNGCILKPYDEILYNDYDSLDKRKNK